MNITRKVSENTILIDNSRKKDFTSSLISERVLLRSNSTAINLVMVQPTFPQNLTYYALVTACQWDYPTMERIRQASLLNSSFLHIKGTNQFTVLNLLKGTKYMIHYYSSLDDLSQVSSLYHVQYETEP